MILSIAPAVRLVDLTPTSRRRRSGSALGCCGAVPLPARYRLRTGDPGDPGVGTARAAIAVRTASTLLVGPDNGLLAPAAAAALGGAARGARHRASGPAAR
ncbi:MAG: SAM-dependent chlorinase/fluorinase [Candidatus Binatia bacterium]